MKKYRTRFYNISKYLIRLLVMRILCVTFLFSFFIYLFEFLEISKFKGGDLSFITQSSIAIMKIPIMIHQTIHFIIFTSIALFLWRISNRRELIAMRSAGLSLFQIMIPLILVLSPIATFDLLVLHKAANDISEQYKEHKKKTPTNHHKLRKFWKQVEHDGLTFTIHMENMQKRRAMLTEIYVTGPKGQFIKSYRSRRSFFRGNVIIFKNLYVINSSTPQKFYRVRACKFKFRISELFEKYTEQLDPRNETLLEAAHSSKIENSPYCHVIRWHYLFSGAVWILLMVPMAFAFCISSRKGVGVLSWNIVGAVSFFVIFLSRELLYAFCISNAYPLIEFIVWLPIIITFLISIFILFEKNEI